MRLVGAVMVQTSGMCFWYGKVRLLVTRILSVIVRRQFEVRQNYSRGQYSM